MLGSERERERERERHDSVWPSASGDVKVAVKLRRRPTAQQGQTHFVGIAAVLDGLLIVF